MWPTSFLPEVTDAVLQASRKAEDAVTRLSAELQVTVVGGGYEARDGKLFNRALVADRGRVVGTYRKIHLFTPHGEAKQFTPGDDPLVVDTSAGRLGVLICYDIRFPELVRWLFYKKAEVLAVPAQWPQARTAHWRALLVARAIENQAYVLGCNRTGSEPSLKGGEPLLFSGDSRIVDPSGESLAAAAGDAAPIVAPLELRKVRTMRRALPITRDRRPAVYQRLWAPLWTRDATRESPRD
jgi:predicted amidohydrolase